MLATELVILRFSIAHHLTFFHLMSIQYKVNLNFTSTEYNCPDMKRRFH